MPDYSEALTNDAGLSAQQEAVVARLLAEAYSKDAPVATRYRDIEPVPIKGDAVPFAQSGRPPMSQRATDHAGLVVAYSFGSLPVGGALSLVLWSLSHVNATDLAIVGLAPVALVAAIGVAARMVGRAVRDGASAMPGTTVHHYSGPTRVQQVHVHSDSRWWGSTINQIPGGER